MLAGESGIVRWFNNNKGYGFLQREAGGDIFVHYSDIRGSGFCSLYEGKRVEFDIVKDQTGFKAQDVTTLDW